MKKPTRTTGAKHGKAKTTHGQLPPFIYLSDVIKQYGSYRLPATGISGGGPGDGEIQAQASFGSFLAEKIASATIPLFDVHSLELIFDSDLDEVLHYLRSTSDQGTTSGIGFEVGRDYCIDAESLNAEINSIESLPRINWQTVEEKSAVLPDNVMPNTPLVSLYVPPPDGWGGDTERRPLTQEFLRYQREKGRFEATTKYMYPRWGGLRAKTLLGPTLPPFSPGANAARNGHEHSDRTYLVGKFNKRGDRALWLDWVVPGQTGGAIGSGGKEPNTGIATRNEKWQERLLAMFTSGPHKGKSHKALCEELARQLYLEKLPSDETEFKPELIRRATRDPGKRKPGGKRPSSQSC